MASYDAGQIFLQVVPSFRGVNALMAAQGRKDGVEYGRSFQDSFDREVGRSTTKVGPGDATARKQGADSGGAFADGFKRRVEAATRSLPPAKLKADASEAERELRDLRLHLEELSGKTVGVDLDAGTALAELDRIDRALDSLGRESADVQVRLDTAGARAQLAHIHAEVNDLDGDDVNIRVDVDTSRGLGSIDTFSGRLAVLATAGAALAPAIVPAAGAAAVALAGLGSAALVGLGGIGALVIGFQGIGDAVKAMGEAQTSAADDATKASGRQASAAAGVASAQRQLAQAEAGLANARATAADQVEDAARRVADAQAAVGEAQREAGDQAATSARRVVDALDGVADAERDAAQAAEDSSRRITDAREAVVDAERDAAEAAEGSARRVVDAREAVVDATEAASVGLAAALRRQGDAEESLADAQESTRQAQVDLTRARQDAQAVLDDLALSTRSAALAEEDAELGLARARERLVEATAEGATGLDLREVELSVRQAELRLDEARDRNEETRASALAAQQAGVDGAEAVLTAQQRVAAARESEGDAARSVTDAENALNQARVEGAERVADAQQDVTDALSVQARQQRDSAEAVADAQTRVTDAVREQEQQRSDSAEAVAEAQARVADAIREQETQALQSARNVAEAQQGVTDAVRDQEQQQRQSAFAITGAIASVEGAQAALAEASRQTGETGSAAMNKLEESMAALSPAGQAFAAFLFGLKPVYDELKRATEEALFPGVQAGLEALLPLMPQITRITASLAGAMGGLFQAMGENLASPAWRPFFDYLEGSGAGILTTLGTAFGDIALGFANLMVAFAPLTEMFVTGIGNMARSFAEWSAGLEQNQGFQTFLQYLRDSVPVVKDFLVALGGAVVNLVTSMAPFGPILLEMATGVLTFIANLDPATLAGIVTGVLGVVGAIRAVGLAMKVLEFAQNANANPILLLVAAFVLAYTSSETFRDIVNGVFIAVRDTIMNVWENYIRPALEAWYGFLINVLIPKLQELWRDVVQPAFTAIAEIIRSAWVDVIQPALSALWKFVVETLIPTVNDLWNNVVKPAFQGISEAVRTAWVDVIQPALSALWKFVVETLIPTVNDLWNNVIKPAFEGISAIIRFAWEGVIKPILEAMWFYISEVLAPIYTWLWNEVVKPAFEGIGSIISYVWNNGIKPVFEALGSFIEDTVAPAFQRGVDAIKALWEGVQEAAKAPVRFVIERVLNGGIIAAFNWIAEKVGLGKIAPIDVPSFLQPGGGSGGGGGGGTMLAFATGGIYPGYTPGRDVGYIGVSGGEAIMRPEWTKAMGSARVHEMNAIARAQGVAGVRRYLGGFADGGIIDRAKDGFDWAKEGVGSAIGDVTRFAKDFVIGGLKKAAEAVVRPILNLLDGLGGGFLADAAGATAHKLFGGLLGVADGEDKKGGDLQGGGFGSSRGGWPAAVLGRVSANTAAAVAFVKQTFGLGSVGTLGNRSNKSDHPLGKALDAMIPGWQSLTGVGLGNKVASHFIGNPDQFGTKYVIWRDQINSGAGWKPYTHPSDKSRRNPTLQHRDHVHVSLFDEGGYLPPGLSTVLNATGRPELILNQQQENAIALALQGKATAPVERPTLVIQGNAYNGVEREVARAMTREAWMSGAQG